jgi:hypothetical protein
MKPSEAFTRLVFLTLSLIPIRNLCHSCTYVPTKCQGREIGTHSQGHQSAAICLDIEVSILK